MKYLSKENFINFNGFAFEELICKIIKEIYGENFTHTTLTNDGGKDFIITNKNLKTWAECKEYTNKLSFNDISNARLRIQTTFWSIHCTSKGSYIAKYCSS